jgi:DNA-directed RNA polymerase subunit RPC12/RpoP
VTAPSACTKVTYRTQDEARKTLTRLVRFRGVQGQTERMEDHAYRCPRCGFWHLTSMTRSDRKVSR